MRAFSPLICENLPSLLTALIESAQQPLSLCASDLRRTGAVRGADARFRTLNQLSQVQGQPVCIYLSQKKCFNCNL